MEAVSLGDLYKGTQVLCGEAGLQSKFTWLEEAMSFFKKAMFFLR